VLAVVSALALSAGAPAACTPPPEALAAPFSCQEWVEADEWSRILTLLRYVPEQDLLELGSKDGAIDWDGVLEPIGTACAEDSERVLDADEVGAVPPLT
jgi:hypothetical protein